MDTNVLVSAIIGHGKPRRLLKLVLKRHTSVSSSEMMAELADVLPRKKFGLTQGQITRFLAFYARRSEVVVLRRHVKAVEQDPEDDTVLDTALNGGARFIVTGDTHLLALGEFEGVRMITVDSALRLLSA